MIPLAQYFADSGNDDFTPFQPAPARKPAAAPRRASDAVTVLAPKTTILQPKTTGLQPKATALQPKAMARPLKPMAPRPAEPQPAPRAMTEPRVTLREVEAERTAWEAERRAHALALQAAVDTARQDGVEAGRALGRMEIEAESESRIEAVRLEIANDHGHALQRSRVEWTEEQADRLADLLILQVAILEETLKLSMNSVLRPLALDARRRQTLEDLVGAVRTIALDGMAYKIAASGPADLLAALEERLGDHAQLLSFESDETQTDIRIDADNTVIETRLSSWRLALEEALS